MSDRELTVTILASPPIISPVTYARRYNVKARSQRWSDRGPDLWRGTSSAIDKALRYVPRLGPFYLRTVNGTDPVTDWQRCVTRAGLRRQLADRLNHIGDGRLVQLANRRKDVQAAVRVQVFPVPDLPSVTYETRIVNAIWAAAWPASGFAGAHVCKHIAGTNQWSQHAYGRAIDRVQNPPAVTNDEQTDWCLRMSREGLWPVWQVLGSRNGSVINAEAPGFYTRAGGADTSHLWHVHLSTGRAAATGTPACA